MYGSLVWRDYYGHSYINFRKGIRARWEKEAMFSPAPFNILVPMFNFDVERKLIDVVK